VESGIRSDDWTMPEEINRVVPDSITNWFFTSSETANDNLRRSGVTDDRIFFVGNTMIDTLLKKLPRLRQPACWKSLKLEPNNYFVITLHRPANVDGEQQLLRLLHAIAEGTRGLPVVFPVHPCTAKNLRDLDSKTPQLNYVDPLGYVEFNYLVKHARGIITDSGGNTEEITVLGVPCLTLRNNTERPETVTIGTNELIGADPSKLPQALARLMGGEWGKSSIRQKWDGRADY
jgi:UDP-N-acetylglucosamine 2-epimerase (non-hydrolysing)